MKLNGFYQKILEKKIFIASLLILVFLISFTHIVGYFFANQDYYYTFVQPTRNGDMPGHLSFIVQAQDGHFLFKNLYNPQEQRALFFHPLWLIMGLFSRVFHLDTAITYQLFKVVFAVIFCFVLRKFLKDFFNLNQEKLLLPFCLFSTGVFTWLIEKDTFLNLYYSPLFACALILILLIFYFTWRYFQERRFYQLVIISLTALLLFLIHFYDIFTILAVMALWTTFLYYQKKEYKDFFPLLSVILGIFPGVVYYFYIFTQEPVLTRWAVNNVTLLPSWQFLAIGYGIIFPLALIGAIKKRSDRLYQYLILWCLAALLMVFSPIPFNRRFVLGLSIPLTILAYSGLKWLMEKSKNILIKTAVITIILPLLMFSSFFVVFLDLRLIKNYGLPQYRKRNYIETFIWMRNNLPKESVVFANLKFWETSISGYTGLTSYWAGGYFSGFNENLDKFYWFFQDNKVAEEKKQFLYQNNINYLFYSDREKILGTFDPSQYDYLKLVYKNQDAEVYRVLKDY